MISVWCVRFRPITSICIDCFLGLPIVCHLKAAVLSKSSTLTGEVVRPLEIVIDPHGSMAVMYAFDLETGINSFLPASVVHEGR
ncbi:hypothetical protein C8N30_2097 [Sulfitobacter guttiformis]|uniref:Uncharacterized protein n=1 Tax=Sulfitobacter guttiformis TaxID=74349 RepID=A0A420DTI2_9RHOB|nr:hypothetical protein C8N30_1987 [Sulfitobacter guttiformis]RKE97488.1 hypothetical protein C8N30_2097 [Sulfitobacter guttiformis]